MNRFKYPILLLIIILSTKLYGDIIMIKSKPAKTCTKITNLKDFPELVMIGLADLIPFSQSKKAFRVKNDSCMEAHKSCPISLYVMNLDYYKQQDLDDINWDNDHNIQKLDMLIENMYYDSDCFSSVVLDLNLANGEDSTYYLYKIKSTYNYKHDPKNSTK